MLQTEGQGTFATASADPGDIALVQQTQTIYNNACERYGFAVPKRSSGLVLVSRAY